MLPNASTSSNASALAPAARVEEISVERAGRVSGELDADMEERAWWMASAWGTGGGGAEQGWWELVGVVQQRSWRRSD